MDDERRRAIQRLVAIPIVDEPEDPSQWDEAQILNERAQLIIKRKLSGEIDPDEADRQLLALMSEADFTVLRLATRLIQVWLQSLLEPPTA